MKIILALLSVAALIQTKALAEASPELAKTIVFIGDSLASGYGVLKEESFPERVGVLLNQKGSSVRIINASVAGSLSAGADARVKYILKSHPNVIVLELGGNDGLQGVPPGEIKKNLASAIDVAQANHVKVLLIGMKVYSNLGSDYSHRFEKIFSDLAFEKHVPLMPFLLQDVALKKDLNQADMKHPNTKGHAILAEKILPYLEKM